MNRHSIVRALLLASALGPRPVGLRRLLREPPRQRTLQGRRDRGRLTRDSVAVANRAPYAPRSLPEAFGQTAGSGGGALRGGGALPTAPVVPDLAPGGRLELRLPPPATPGPYRVGVGDLVQLASRSAPDTLDPALTGALAGNETRQQYTVRDDGAIAVPEVGAVMIGGLTIEEAEQRLFERFIETGIDPDFSLEIAGFNSQVITVGGEVGAPTALPVTLNVPTLDQALTAAGGLQVTTPEYASIRIYRGGTLYQIPLESYQSRGDLRSVQLLPGDSIFVDTSYDLDRALAYYQQEIQLSTLRRTDRTTALDELETEVTL
ncbi:MAG TPA: polysaccharide biosynthesis/export family protein, partial [Rubellimicrobium sp.]|nr:polysaccharide biosynthesis/export family protein [Rubellimicrobium sp.]